MEKKLKLTEPLGDVWMRDPVMGAMVNKMEVVILDDDKITDTMATDGVHLYINAEWASKLTRNQMAIVLAHESLHPILGHTVRRGNVDSALWNKAADAAENHLLAGWPAYDWLRETGITADTLNMPAGKDAEFYAAGLKQKQQDEEKKDKQESGGDGSEGDGEGAGEDTQETEQEGQGAVESGDEGKGVPRMGGDVLDAPEGEQAQAEAANEQRVMDAIKTAEIAGNLPGWAQELKAKLTKAPKLNWKILLRQWLVQKAKVRRSYERPNRRQGVQGGDLLRPSKSGRKVGKLAFLVDVSGSMFSYADKLNQAVGEIVGLSESMPDTQIRIIQWDTAVMKTTDIKGDAASKTIGWNWSGGGGTTIAPALKAAKEWGAEVQVVWTDGYFSMPERVLTPTLWCIVTAVEVSKKLGSTIKI